MPVTCGRTSATRYATVRPGSSSTIPALRGTSVSTPTSAGGGCAAGWASPPQPERKCMAAGAATVPVRVTHFSLRFAASVLQHSREQVDERGDLLIAQAAQMAFELLVEERLNLVADREPLVGERQVHHAPIGLAALALEQPLVLEPVE